MYCIVLEETYISKFLYLVVVLFAILYYCVFCILFLDFLGIEVEIELKAYLRSLPLGIGTVYEKERD